MHWIKKNAGGGAAHSVTRPLVERSQRAGGSVVLVSALVLLGSLFAPHLPANAVDEPMAPPASADEAASFSKVSGYTLEQAQRVLDGQEEFSLLLMELELNSGIYAGGAIAPNDTADAWIAFTTEPDKSTLEQISALSLTTEVRVGAAWTTSELKTELNTVHEALEATSGVAGAIGMLELETQQLEFTVWGDGTAPLEPNSLQQLARQDDKFASMSVQLSIAELPAATNEVVGGQPLSNGCTSAFTVTAQSGEAGVLSAAHCPNAADGFTFCCSVEADSTDAQVHFTTNVENRIRVNATGSTQTITSYYLPAAGGSAHFYGTTSGVQESTIYSTNVCWPNLGCGFIAVNGSVTAGGDSGGPWYNGNAALGVHKGTAFVGLANRSVFTYVGNALHNMVLTLCTTSICGII